LSLSDPVAASTSSGWKVGDKLLLTSTDYSPLQNEELVIQSIVDDYTVTVTTPLQWMHFGQVTEGVDERAEVALLNRNIVIQGSSEGTLGGHLIILRGFAAAHIEGVEFVNMGQDQIARYPVHFHMCGVVPPGTYVRYNSIHNSVFRCVTIHASHGVLVDSSIQS
jgi:cell migration-inducing and hyaluronan-binding protein